jgi:hypothetical protein
MGMKSRDRNVSSPRDFPATATVVGAVASSDGTGPGVVGEPPPQPQSTSTVQARCIESRRRERADHEHGSKATTSTSLCRGRSSYESGGARPGRGSGISVGRPRWCRMR